MRNSANPNGELKHLVLWPILFIVLNTNYVCVSSFAAINMHLFIYLFYCTITEAGTRFGNLFSNEEFLQGFSLSLISLGGAAMLRWAVGNGGVNRTV
jgi:hypothetical protein